MAVEARLLLQIAQFKANYTAAKNHAKKESAEMRKASSGMGDGLAANVKSKLMPAIGRIAGWAAVAKTALDSVGLAMDRQSQLAGLAGVSLENVSDQVARLQELAKLPGLGFDQAMRGTIKLQAVGQSAEQAEAILREMGNALALVGGGAQDLDGVILAITQIISKGKVSAEEINQIAERLPQVRELMKAAFGTADTDALQKMGIESEVFIDGLVTAASGLSRAAATSKTEMDNMKDAWASLLVELGSGPEGLAGDLFGMLAKIFGGVEAWADSVKTSISGMWEFAQDLVTGGLSHAQDELVNRETEAARKKYEGDDALAAKKAAKEADDAATAASKASAEAMAAEKEQADELAKAMEKLAALKDRMAMQKIEDMEDPAKLGALQDRLSEHLKNTVGNFYFETSTEGLRELAQAREGNEDLPTEGVNSAAEAYAWLQEAMDLERRIAETEQSILTERERIAKEEAARQEELADMRAQAEKGALERLSPAEQARHIRDQLGESLGININGLADIEKGLRLTRMEAESARESGDVEGEKAALQRMMEAQGLAREFGRVTDGLAAGAGRGGGQGAYQDFVDAVFDRDPAADQLAALREAAREQHESRRLLEQVLVKMDDPPERSRFSDFGGM